MRAIKCRDLKQVLRKKGFIEVKKGNSSKNKHHIYYYLFVNGKKQRIYTYISHGSKEYNNYLMGEMKKQLKFNNSEEADDFFDCPMTEEDYIKMLKEKNEL